MLQDAANYSRRHQIYSMTKPGVLKANVTKESALPASTGNGTVTVVMTRFPVASVLDVTGKAIPPPCCLEGRAGATVQHTR